MPTSPVCGQESICDIALSQMIGIHIALLRTRISSWHVRYEGKIFMARKPLTEDEITTLLRSPYVAQIISGRISFTPEFKDVMYKGLINGKTIRMTLIEHGISPDILGKRRLWSIAEKLRAKADRKEAFADRCGQNTRKTTPVSKEMVLSARVDQLEHELAYTRQQVEFLKKIHLADLEARKSWESKQRRK